LKSLVVLPGSTEVTEKKLTQQIHEYKVLLDYNSINKIREMG
jgi:hypothetical protein